MSSDLEKRRSEHAGRAGDPAKAPEQTCRISDCGGHSKRYRLCPRHLQLFAQWRWAQAQKKDITEELVVEWATSHSWLKRVQTKDVGVGLDPVFVWETTRDALRRFHERPGKSWANMTPAEQVHRVVPHSTLKVHPIGRTAQEVYGPYEEPDPRRMYQALQQWQACPCATGGKCNFEHRDAKARLTNSTPWKFRQYCDLAVAMVLEMPPSGILRSDDLVEKLECSVIVAFAVIDCLAREGRARLGPNGSLLSNDADTQTVTSSTLPCRVLECRESSEHFSGLCEQHHLEYCRWRYERSSPVMPGTNCIDATLIPEWCRHNDYRDRADEEFVEPKQ